MNEPSVNSVIYLSYDGITDPLGQSQVLPYLLGLCNEGFDIISFEKPVNYRQEEETLRKLISGHPSRWHPKVYHKKHRFYLPVGTLEPCDGRPSD